ncbi:WD40-repeat-containing domain protein [Crepidotus variabilis]|uniref:WD40-repeat-containing domain protein n=1 Tax=Crepidotus variabilis TaxID=179855 RepID=A0A9P6JKR7_9AGAR|nr:WD40-repeat-containing domain protein [Crepidotus variabilis]
MTFTTNFIDAVFGKPRYHPVAKLNGHGGAINALAFNKKGTILASGGDDKQVRLWDLSTNLNFQTLFETHDWWGQITRLEFTESGGTDWLWIGTGRGRIAIFRRSQTSSFVEVVDRQVFGVGDSVEHFSVDPSTSRLAATSHFGNIGIYQLKRALLEMIWEKTVEKAIPRAIVTRDAETSNLVHSKTLPTVIGSVAICPSKKFVLMDNMADGFDLYTTAARTGLIRTFPVKSTQRFIRNGAFGEDGDIVVCGSLSGKAYIFEFDSTEPAQVLHHGGGNGMVQTLAVSSNSKESWIATGVLNGQFDICIWRKQTQIPPADLIPKDVGVSSLQLLINIMLVLLVATLTSEKWLPSTKEHIAILTAQVTTNMQGIKIVEGLDDDTLRRLLGLEAKVGLDTIDYPHSHWKISDEDLERRYESSKRFAQNYRSWDENPKKREMGPIVEGEKGELDKMAGEGHGVGAEYRERATGETLEAQVEEFLRVDYAA